MTKLRRAVESLGPVLDLVLRPATYAAGVHMRMLRRIGWRALPGNRAALDRVGVYPIMDHYYEPMFHPRHVQHPLSNTRDLPGLDLREEAQWSDLEKLAYANELRALPELGATPGHFAYSNGTFFYLDAELLYSLVRSLRPRRIIEVGSGYSTLVVRAALARNDAEGAAECAHTCIEPYEMPWLEKTGARIVRRRAEELPLEVFLSLECGDVLFIDSSHVIRPQGDVLHLYQTVLPRLRPGVIVHVHDIFTPRDYPHTWVVQRRLFWNEQYLLEAILASGRLYRVRYSLNHLWNSDPERVARALPIRPPQPGAVPTSFWIERTDATT